MVQSCLSVVQQWYSSVAPPLLCDFVSLVPVFWDTTKILKNFFGNLSRLKVVKRQQLKINDLVNESTVQWKTKNRIKITLRLKIQVRTLLWLWNLFSMLEIDFRRSLAKTRKRFACFFGKGLLVFLVKMNNFFNVCISIYFFEFSIKTT